MEPVRFLGVFPIGDTNPAELPVPDLDRALPYYVERLGFRVESREEAPVRRAVLRRDEITLGFAENGGDPEQASCYISVTDVEAGHAQAAASNLAPSALRVDNHGGARYRVFFLKDDVGLCYCLGQKLEA